MNPWQWFVKTFTTENDGGSARKLSAFFAVVIVGGYITYINTTPENVESILIIWLLFAVLCLGMVTFQQIIEFKNGKKDENKN